MHRTVRTLLTFAAALPVAVAATLVPAPSALAVIDSAQFSGLSQSSCAMPYGPEGPRSGPFTCDHIADSVSCAAVVDTGDVYGYVKTCSADLVSGHTTGSATAYTGYAVWTCSNGAGTGMFRYQPSTAQPQAFTFPVTLAANAGWMEINGSYVQAGTNRTIVVRARFYSPCSPSATGAYEGTITAI